MYSISMPLISIILPIYNSNKKRLSQSIESVLSQSFKDFEFIIINDASTNTIEEIIIEYQQKDKRIVYIKNEHNIRLTKTLNKGLKVAQWEYIARIDDDDIWMDDHKLQKQFDFLHSHPDYALCGTNIILENTRTQEQTKVYMQETDQEIRNRMLLATQFSHSSIMIRKEAIDKYGRYDPDYNLMEDHELWLRIGKEYKFYNLQDFTTLYRINPHWVSLQNRRKQQQLALKLCWKYRKDYPWFIKWLLWNIALNILPEKLIWRINKLNRLCDKPLI